MVDTGDLKSPDLKRSCGFESHLRYKLTINSIVYESIFHHAHCRRDYRTIGLYHSVHPFGL